jgi:beta-lactamase regulating signal transducer with metallopeptidase domain
MSELAPAMANIAQLVVERVVNSLPEGVLLTACAWLLLRAIGRQNARTRFAVWSIALAGVAVLPFLGGHASAAHAANIVARPEVTVPAFWAIAFLGLWIPLSCVALARVIAGLGQVRALRRDCAEIDADSLDAVLSDTLRAGKNRRRVRILVSEKVRVPAAVGFRDPAIVLPAWCLREMSAAELQPIVIHELAHLERRDDWTNLLQKIVRAVLFFHPAVWWIDRRLAAEREMACDDAVLAAMGNARAYAGSLVGLLERSCARRGWTMAQAAVSKAREVSQRIARILDGGATANPRFGRGALGVAAALCAASFGVFTLAPQIVGFAPDTDYTSSSAPGQTKDVLGIHGDLYHASVVPAAFHPQQAVAKPAAAHRGAAKAAAAAHPAHYTAAPGLTLAKLDVPQSPDTAAKKNERAQQQMLMVLETAENETPLALTAPVAAPPAGSAPALPAVILAGSPGILQIRTLQVLEEDDTGWHLRVYHIVVLVPASAEGSQNSST